MLIVSSASVYICFKTKTYQCFATIVKRCLAVLWLPRKKNKSPHTHTRICRHKHTKDARRVHMHIIHMVDGRVGTTRGLTYQTNSNALAIHDTQTKDHSLTRSLALATHNTHTHTQSSKNARYGMHTCT